jgi:outer membrane protein assembly factor BamD
MERYAGIAVILSIFLVGSPLISCGERDLIDIPVADLYDTAMAKMEGGDEDEAREIFKHIQARSDRFTDEAAYRVGETYYRQKLYDDAYAEFSRLINRYPASPWCDDAQYMMGMCRLDAALAVDKDPTYIEEAADEFFTLIEEYEGSELVDDASGMINECRRRLAEKDLYVAKYYKKTRKYEAAIVYLEAMQEDYSDLDIIPEVLYVEAECYKKQDDIDNARFIYEKLVKDYSDTAYGKKAAERLKEIGE